MEFDILMWQWEVVWARVDDLANDFHCFILCLKETKWEVKGSPQQPMLRWGTAFVHFLMFKASSGRAGAALSAVTICSASSFSFVSKAGHGISCPFSSMPSFQFSCPLFPFSTEVLYLQIFLIFTLTSFFLSFLALLLQPCFLYFLHWHHP